MYALPGLELGVCRKICQFFLRICNVKYVCICQHFCTYTYMHVFARPYQGFEVVICSDEALFETCFQPPTFV